MFIALVSKYAVSLIVLCILLAIIVRLKRYSTLSNKAIVNSSNDNINNDTDVYMTEQSIIENEIILFVDNIENTTSFSKAYLYDHIDLLKDSIDIKLMSFGYDANITNERIETYIILELIIRIDAISNHYERLKHKNSKLIDKKMKLEKALNIIDTMFKEEYKRNLIIETNLF